MKAPGTIRIRDVAQESKAQETLDKTFHDYPELEEVYRGLEWRIARQPKAGVRVPKLQPPTYVIHANAWLDSPELVLVYQVENQHKICIIAARVVEAEGELDDDDDLPEAVGE